MVGDFEGSNSFLQASVPCPGQFSVVRRWLWAEGGKAPFYLMVPPGTAALTGTLSLHHSAKWRDAAPSCAKISKSNRGACCPPLRSVFTTSAREVTEDSVSQGVWPAACRQCTAGRRSHRSGACWKMWVCTYFYFSPRRKALQPAPVCLHPLWNN